MTALHAEEILKLEFEYARETAMQAQNDRTVVFNLYLILVGGIGSLLLAAVSIIPSPRLDLPTQALALLAFVLALLGVMTLFKLIRLRQAWFDSVRAMNAIKGYYLHSFPELDSAFLWKMNTVPALGKAWTITFILSLMVIVIDSIAFTAAFHFLELRGGDTRLLLDGIVLVVAFGMQILFYFYQLRPLDELEASDSEKQSDESI
ncbi:MAG TPA: hypothetical protein VFD70_25120 [Anaerolineae bacterium]|nr:hypothetical protein [Anaerolineae bacterium]